MLNMNSKKAECHKALRLPDYTLERVGKQLLPYLSPLL